MLNCRRHNPLHCGAVNTASHILTQKIAVFCYGLYTLPHLGGIFHFFFQNLRNTETEENRLNPHFTLNFLTTFSQSAFAAHLANLELNILESQLDALTVVLFGKHFSAVAGYRQKKYHQHHNSEQTKNQKKVCERKIKLTIQYALPEKSCN